MSEWWTASMIEARFDEAMSVLRRLPNDPNPQRRLTGWPVVLCDFWEAYGQHDVKLRLPAPSPDAIDRMHETFGWLSWLEEEERKLVLWRGAREPWKAICRRICVDRSTAWRWWTYALVRIAARLEGVPVRRVLQHLMVRQIRPASVEKHPS